jgi:MFS family permease
MGGVLLCSAFLSLGVSLGHAVMPPDGEGKEPNALTELLGGFQTIRREPEPRLVISLMATHFMLVGAMDVLFVILAFRFLAIGSAGVGYLNAAFGVGGLLGAAVTVTLIGRQRFAPPLLWGAMAWGIGLGLVGLAPNRLIGPLCIVLVGAGRPLVDVAGRTLLQRVVADQVLSRVFGVVEGLSMGAQGAGMVLVPALVALLSPRAALIALALILPAMAVLNWRRLNAIDIRTAVPIIRLTLLREVPFFAPLWPDIADTLAGHLILVERAAGSVIIQQGEAGDRFYIIAEGQVSVVKNGVQANVLGPAGFFGEIALLRDVPRTATVTALSDVQLYALEREPFLQSISGHQTSMREAEAVVRARMGESVEEAAIPPA